MLQEALEKNALLRIENRRLQIENERVQLMLFLLLFGQETEEKVFEDD
jgi:hypothetical protein